MIVGIIGLGLIGGSFAKIIKKNQPNTTVLGVDIDQSVIERAKLLGVIDGEISPPQLSRCDLVLVALYPSAIIEALSEYATYFKKDALVIDCGGVKSEIVDCGCKIARENGFAFIGGHPMAGREVWGFHASKDTLFSGASMILTPDSEVSLDKLAFAKRFFLDIGFGKVSICSPMEHDNIVAYTSHLPHIISNAYIRNPSALKHRGFSAGSFKDMSRVALINGKMWSEIFIDNKENLMPEINNFIDRLTEIRNALANENQEMLCSFLTEGNDIKKLTMAREE